MDAVDTTPFDMFTMLPRTEDEFTQAMAHQGEVCSRNGKGFAITAQYLWDTLKIDDPVKAIDLIWGSLSPAVWKVWFDARQQVFLVEPYDVPKKSSLILPH